MEETIEEIKEKLKLGPYIVSNKITNTKSTISEPLKIINCYKDSNFIVYSPDKMQIQYIEEKLKLGNYKIFNKNTGITWLCSGSDRIKYCYKSGDYEVYEPEENKQTQTENIEITKIEHQIDLDKVKLKLIGESSYAKVFSYFDSFYEKEFAIKRANKDLNEKELERFKREFNIMKELSSPYIVEVYKYNADKNEYIMEYLDTTLEKYIKENNDKLNKVERKKIVKQILKAFKYIHSKKENGKEMLHRDISPNNILIKIYDNEKIIKVSDFGLVKIPDSNLTKFNTEFKGSFNDPNLYYEGFGNYAICHETYALTLVICYAMTGKDLRVRAAGQDPIKAYRKNLEKIKDDNLRNFFAKGISPNHSKRYQNIDEMIKDVNDL